MKNMDTHALSGMEERIIEAAKLVFVRKGYEAATMSDIATEAGIGRTALHYYYRTKEMLFDAVFGRLLSDLLPNIGRILDEEATMLEKLPLIIEQYLSVIQSNPGFPFFVVTELNRDPQNLFRTVMRDPSRIQPLFRMRRQIEEEMEQGLLRKMPMLDVMTTLVSLAAFPLLVKAPLTAVFLEDDPARFDSFIDNRKVLITEIMTRLLTPDVTNRIEGKL